MDVTLIIHAKGRSRRFHLQGQETVIGREKGANLRVPSGEVSRRHCIIRKEEGFVTVEDLQSRNGTFLNGTAVSAKEVVRPGDQLKVGPVSFVVDYELTAAGIDALFQNSFQDDSAIADVIPVKEEQEPTTAHMSLPPEDDGEPILGLLEDEEVPSKDLELAADSWRLPGGEDLRDILAQMDEPKPRRRRE
jgi:pSer/pThr/pTyr-binding forkhead associated (FHA) protein